MSRIRVAVVDDEPLARQRIRRLLQLVGGDVFEVVQEHAHIHSLLAAAPGAALDLLFLDIEMPGGDGFSALAQWPGARPLVVFVSAYEQHGVRAFDAAATDYLLKPVSPERLVEALAKVRAALHQRETQALPAAKRVALPIGPRIDLVDVTDIALVTADGNYLEIHATGRRYVLRQTLKAMEAELEGCGFLQVHRACLVRAAAVREVRAEGSGRYRLQLHDGRSVHTGRHYRAQVLSLMQGGA